MNAFFADTCLPLGLRQDYIASLPIVPQPEAFGLHENADITKDQNDTALLFKSLLATGGGGGDSGNKGGVEDRIADAVRGCLEKLPDDFDIEKVQNKYPVMYEESMNTVLVQVRGPCSTRQTLSNHIFLCVCLSVRLSVCPSISVCLSFISPPPLSLSLSACPSVRPSVCLSVRLCLPPSLFFSLFLSLSLSPSLPPSLCLCLPVCLTLSVSLSLSLSLSIYLSIYLSLPVCLSVSLCLSVCLSLSLSSSVSVSLSLSLTPPTRLQLPSVSPASPLFPSLPLSDSFTLFFLSRVAGSTRRPSFLQLY